MRVFFFKKVETLSISFEVESIELYQELKESLSTYYRKVCVLLKNIKVKDRSTSTSTLSKLTKIKSTFLDIVLRVFNRDLNNLELRKKAIRVITYINRSLLNLYTLTKKTRKINLKVRKLLDEKTKIDEF